MIYPVVTDAAVETDIATFLCRDKTHDLAPVLGPFSMRKIDLFNKSATVLELLQILRGSYSPNYYEDVLCCNLSSTFRPSILHLPRIKTNAGLGILAETAH